jgi:hypothetical protein
MLKLIRNAVGAIALLALAGCQTSGLSAGGLAQLQSAGYTAVPGIPSSLGQFSNVAAYICPEDRCSTRKVVSVLQSEGAIDAKGQNLEQQFRDSSLGPTQKAALFRRSFNLVQPDRRITSTKLVSDANQVALDFDGFGKTPLGSNVRFAGRFIVKGNTGTAVVAIAEKATDARRALAAALSN